MEDLQVSDCHRVSASDVLLTVSLKSLGQERNHLVVVGEEFGVMLRGRLATKDYCCGSAEHVSVVIFHEVDERVDSPHGVWVF